MILLVKRVLWYARRILRGDRYTQLFRELRSRRPTTIMEIGTWNGKNALRMIEAAANTTPGAKITYYGFDLFEEMTPELYHQEVSKWPPSQEEVKKQLEASGATVHLYKGDTNKVLVEVLPNLPPIDFVFIDGGHSIDTIQRDWDQISQHMSPQTVVIFDDYWENRTDAGCKTVVDSIDRSRFIVEVLPITDNYHNKDFGRLSIRLATAQLKENAN